MKRWSLPVRAGEYRGVSNRGTPCGVDPRAGRGRFSTRRHCAPSQVACLCVCGVALSPRRPVVVASASIAACAGLPRLVPRRRLWRWPIPVHSGESDLATVERCIPVCGGGEFSARSTGSAPSPCARGNLFPHPKKKVALGRSPCVRGTSGPAGHYRMCGRAIPVGAGEPVPPVCSSSLVGVHPRARGESGSRNDTRRRGGSIPVVGGETTARWTVETADRRVDPRACGV